MEESRNGLVEVVSCTCKPVEVVSCTCKQVREEEVICSSMVVVMVVI
jgi:hypothetical protein